MSTTRTATNRDGARAAAPDALDEQVTFAHHLRASGGDLFPLVETLLREKFKMNEAFDKVRAYQEKLREQMEALCAPENYPAVITRVVLNGTNAVEVACGSVRVQVAVHPDVDLADLRVGARGLLSAKRNCLLKVYDEAPDWQEVGTFEGYLDEERRLLLKHQEQLIAVTPSEDLIDTELKKGDLVGFDREGGRLAYARIDPPGREDLFFEDTPADCFAELGGLDAEIAKLKWVVEFRLRHAEIAARYRLRAKCGILLEGPPGNGKTKLARCLANYVAALTPAGECRFMAVSGSSDYSMWLGQSEQRIIARFEAARALAERDGVPVVMFFDEIDAIGRQRGSDFGSSAPDRILSTFLAQLDGMKPISNLIVIGATNRADTLDPGLIRPGRLGDVKVRIPAPNRAGCRAILARYLKPLPTVCDANELVTALVSRIYSEKGEFAELASVKLRDGSKITVGGRDLISGAMLESVVANAGEEAAEREAHGGATGLSDEDLARALDRELRASAGLLRPGNVRNYVTRLPQDMDPVAVEVFNRVPSPSQYLRGA